MTADYGDVARATLRTITARIEHELSELPLGADGNELGTALRASWSELVSVLALGPAPETRECPSCHAIGMRLARRCGRCWTALAPMAGGAS
jgi:hypothetical protein